jgi:hypothetical protein
MSEFFATNAPDPPHWTPNSCFGSFQTISLLHKLRCKTGWTGAINAQVRATQPRQKFFAMNASDPPHWTSISSFGAFRTVLLLSELWCKPGWTGAINAEVRATQSRRKYFATNTSNPPYWTSDSCFGVLRTVLLLSELRRKIGWTGAMNAQVHWTKSRSNFPQRTHLIHPIVP